VVIFIGVLLTTPVGGTAVTLGLYLLICVYYLFAKNEEDFPLVERTNHH
jgi:hypothetical protein